MNNISRNGAVRSTPGNVLWFEFLIDQNLIESHINKEDPDPSIYNLIIKFITESLKEPVIKVENNTNLDRSTFKYTKKAVALKILALKIFAHLNWNLTALENKIPLNIQFELVRSLLYLLNCDDPKIESYCSLDFQSADHQTIFAVTLYHRWILKSCTYVAIQCKQPKSLEDLKNELQEQSTDSYCLLNKCFEFQKNVMMPTFHSFQQLTADIPELNSSFTKWETNCVVINPDEFKCQLHFELGKYSVFCENYESAQRHFRECSSIFNQLNAIENPLCTVSQKELSPFCATLGINSYLMDMPKSPGRFLKVAIMNNYKEVIPLLQTDNILQQIPLIQRDSLELELQVLTKNGGITVAKDLLFKVQLLNALRRIMVLEYTPFDFVQSLRSNGSRGMGFFLTSIHSVIFDVSQEQQQTLQRFLMELMLRDLQSSKSSEQSIASTLLADEALRKRFSQMELNALNEKMNSEAGDIVEDLDMIDNLPPEILSRSPRLEFILLQQQLTKSYDPEEVKNLLQKLSAIKQNVKDNKPLFRINPKWELPIPLQGVVMNLPKGFLQDFVYILLAKSRELSCVKDFRKGASFLEKALREAKLSTEINSGTIYKLNRLVEWEILLIQINEFIDNYPHTVIDRSELVTSCKSCISASLAGDIVIPRLEVLESCALALLNLAEWEVLTTMEKRWIYIELAGAFAFACQDIAKYKGNKKISRDAWDLILPVFGSVSPSNGTGIGTGSSSATSGGGSGSVKRNNAGGAVASPSAGGGGGGISRSSLLRFLTQLREPTCLAVATSLLARLHNVLRDEPAQEINCLYVSLWPAVVSNANSYNARVVAEILMQVVVEALKFVPNDYSLLKILGDLTYVSSDWANCLRFYLEAGALSTDYYMQPVPKTIFDDYIYKRMIRCCSQLQCYTQAGVLCQFLDEIDYPTAFKFFQETKNLHCADAMDAYYPCIWDLTLLEFIVNMHSKRGETLRKQQVIKLMGALELNGNNNEEIQREAANLRKGWLLRALTRQYCINSNTVLGYSNFSDVNVKNARLTSH